MMAGVEIQDAQGHPLEEVTLHLSPAEVADLLVGASSLDDGDADHAVIRDDEGRSVALYLGGEAAPLNRSFDWWVGPIVLLLVVVLAAGAFTLARGLIHSLF